jgi:hypothetical protein
VEVHVVVINTQVEALEKPIIPKPIPLVIPKIGVGVEVILIYSITHASKVFTTPYTVLKDAPIIKKLELQSVF